MLYIAQGITAEDKATRIQRSLPHPAAQHRQIVTFDFQFILESLNFLQIQYTVVCTVFQGMSQTLADGLKAM